MIKSIAPNSWTLPVCNVNFPPFGSAMESIKLTAPVVSFCAVMGILSIAPSAKADSIKIMARAVCSGDIPVITGNVGHAAIAFYNGSGNVVGTRGMWPGGVRTNDPADMEMAKGNGCGLRTRTATVSASRREWAWNQVATSGGTNCQEYALAATKLPGADKFCSCVNFSTRVWRMVTSDWERWQFQTTPKILGDTIQGANRGQVQGLFDNGKEWK
jgi:hypothetical protein